MSDNAKFCRNCGTAVRLAEKVKTEPVIPEAQAASPMEPVLETAKPEPSAMSNESILPETAAIPEVQTETAAPAAAEPETLEESVSANPPVQSTPTTPEMQQESVTQNTSFSTENQESQSEQAADEVSFSDLVCPVCGAPLEVGAKFCTSCRRCVDPTRGFTGVDPLLRKNIPGKYIIFKEPYSFVRFRIRYLLCRRHYVWFEQTNLKVGKIIVKRIPYQQISSVQIKTKVNKPNLVHTILFSWLILFSLIINLYDFISIWVALYLVYLLIGFIVALIQKWKLRFGFMQLSPIGFILFFLLEIDMIKMKYVEITDGNGKMRNIPIDYVPEVERNRFLRYLQTMTGIVQKS